MAEPSPTDLKLLKVSQFYVVAMFSVFVWDVIVTFKAEWNKIWVRNWGMGNWNVIKAFYIANKYGMLVEMTLSLIGWTGSWSPEACHRYVKAEPGWGLVPHTAADVLLLLRTWTFTGRRTPVLAFLTAFLLANTGVRVAGILKFVAIPGVSACIATGPPGGHSIVLLFWIMPFMFTTSIVFLTMGQSILNRMNHRAELPFFIQLYRDGIFYVLIIFLAELLNALFFAQPNSALQSVNVPLDLTMVSMMCSRIVLHLWAEPTAFLPNFAHYPSTSSTTLDAKSASYRPTHGGRPGSSASSTMRKAGSIPLTAAPSVGVRTVVQNQVEQSDDAYYFEDDTLKGSTRESLRKMPFGSPSPNHSPSPRAEKAFYPSPPSAAAALYASPPGLPQVPPYLAHRGPSASVPVTLPQSSPQGGRHIPATPPDYRTRDPGPLV